MNKKIIGYCKECGSELFLENKIYGYNIYEYTHCYYPSHCKELGVEEDEG